MNKSLPKFSNWSKIKSLNSKQLAVILFTAVCLISGVLVIKETPAISFPVISLLGKLNIGIGSNQPPVSLSTPVPYLSDNYNRCQNKLGLELPLLEGGTQITGSLLQQREQQMQQMYLSGMRYVLLRIYNYGQYDKQNLQNLILAAYNHNLVPVVVPENSPEGVSGGVTANASKLVDIYRAVAAEIGPAYFIASTSARDLLNNGNYTDSVAIASSVADQVKAYSNIVTATPPMLIDTTKQIEQATWMKDSGLLLEDYDVMLLMLQNSDAGYSTNASDYLKTAYAEFVDVGNPIGTRFAPKQWLRDENQGKQQFQRAIIMNFAPAQGTIPAANDKLVDRLGYDFGRFSDDQDVDAVIMSNGFAGGSLSYADYAKINLAGTNCNYDQVNYNTKFADSSAAKVCDQSIGTNNTSGATTSAKITCSATTCQSTINYTIQVGLPVRSMGSNTALGTDTNPYMPACARAALTVNLPYYDFLNQFAGKLQSSDGKTYMVPWLGNGINCALAAKIKFFNPQSLFEADTNFSLGAAVNQAAGELASELAQDGGIYPGPALWAWVTGNDQKTKYTDERVIYSGKSIGIDKAYINSVDSLSYYVPQVTANTFEQSMTCGGQVQRVKTDPQNMIYGGQQIIDQDKWTGTPQQLCYEYLAPKTGDVHVAKTGKGISCQVKATAGCTCDLSTVKVQMTTYGIALGSCKASSDMINRCLQYNGGADDSDAANSGVVLQSTRFASQITQNVPKYDIPGAYDALASTYKLVQDKLAERNEKVIFNEKWGWKSDVILRAYADVSGGNMTTPRKNNLVENSSAPIPQNIPLSSTAATTNSLTTPTAQCKVGVNFAIPYSSLSADQISEAVNVGYGYGQVIVYDDGNPDDVTNKLNQMCGAGITPVIRSCTTGQCGFSNGTQQGNLLKKVISASTCSQVYAVCGHNEPISENPNGMTDEGHWAKACVDAIGDNPKVKITTPIFNATYADAANRTVVDNVADFMNGYGNFSADKSKFGCVALNTYDNNGGDFPANKADVYYDRVMNIPAFSDMKACVMETGDFLSNSDSAITGLINRLAAKSQLLFLLGFDWTGTNPDSAWKNFVMPDKGKAAVGNFCVGGGSVTFGLVGNYYNYDEYEAEGNNFYEVSQYYAMMGLYDELNRIYDVLAAQNALPSGELKLNGTTPYLEAAAAEYFAGLPGCNTDAYNKIVQQVGSPVNCIGTIKDNDPLGDFLCGKGYNVSGQCQLYCPVETNPNNDAGSVIFTGKFSELQCPLETQHSCFQGPYGGYTHCDENDLPMDFFPNFSPNVTEDFFAQIKNLPIDQQFQMGDSTFGPRDERVFAPEDGTVLVAGKYQYGGQVIIAGKAGIVYTLDHIDPAKFLVKAGDHVSKGQQLGTLWHGYGYRNMHLHLSATLDGVNVDPYLVFGDLLGCNVVRPASGAKYQSAASSGMCQYGNGQLNDNKCISAKNPPADGNKVIAKYEAAYGNGNASGSSTTTSTAATSTTVVASSSGTAQALTTGANCAGATCPVLNAKNGVTYPACTNADYSLCDNPDQMNIAFGDGSPLSHAGLCTDQAKQVGSEIHTQLISFLGQGFSVNPKVVSALQQVEKDVQSQATSYSGSTYVFPSGTYTFDAAGAFNARPIRGYEDTIGSACKISNHSWGTALDLNAGTNQFQASTCSYDMPPEVVWAFEKNGFRWGGRYGEGAHFDPMHFEYCQAGTTSVPPPTQNIPNSCPVIPNTGGNVLPPGSVTKELVLSLCSPNVTTFLEVDPSAVVSAFKKVTGRDVSLDRVNQIISMARSQNINPAFLFGFWYTEGGFRGDNVAGHKGDSVVAVGYDFGCGIDPSCNIAERIPAGSLNSAALKQLTDERFNRSLQCAAKSPQATCSLLCSYSNIATGGTYQVPKGPLQQPGLGGFLECYGPVSDSNPYFASNFITIYDAIFPPGTLAGRSQTNSCRMYL